MLKYDAAVGTRTSDSLAIDANCPGFHRQKTTDKVEQS